MKMHWPHRRRAAGFTLVEILVVIGIIVILVGVLVPMISRAMRQAKNTRTAADMQTIGTALEAFKFDHGDYPRPQPGVPTQNLGAAILGIYLNGSIGDGYLPNSTSTTPDDTNDPPPYDAGKEYFAGDVVQIGGKRYVSLRQQTGVAPSTPTAGGANAWTQWDTMNDSDRADGPGIRIRAGGKKFGPYITSEKMSMHGLAFSDSQGNPILYFVGRPGGGNVYTTTNSYVGTTVSPAPTGARATMKWDADDNIEAFRHDPAEANAVVIRRIKTALGDTNGDGGINVGSADGETANAPDQPYILWAAGTDGKFGPEIDANSTPPATWDKADWDRCDDIVTFRK